MRVLFVAIMLTLFSSLGLADMQVMGDGALSGDTLIVMMPNGFTAKVQIVGIAAPKPGQPFFRESMDFLAGGTYKKKLILLDERIVGPKNDLIYSATVGIVGEKADLGLHLLRSGWAWALENAPLEYKEANLTSKYAKIGLWVDPNPIAPWKWNTKKKKMRKS